MTKQPFMFPMKFFLCIAGLVAIGFLIFTKLGSQSVLSSKPLADVVSAPSVSGSGTPRLFESVSSAPASVTPVNRNLSSALVITYRPGMTRARRQIPDNMQNMIYSNNKNWWLYAQSEKDAQWLDKFGYPTPAEHDRLISASDAELETLAKSGDLNARVHQAVREAEKAYATWNADDANSALMAFMTSLNDGGPYQAVMVAKCFGELSRKFQRLPTEEQTEERRSMIQRFSDVQEQASLMTSLYGDELGKGAQRAMTNEQKVKYLGLKAKPELSMDRVTNMLTAQARLREQNGLQPIVILPRPLEASDKEKVVIERY